MKNRFYYFKIVFLPISAAIFSAMLVYGLFEIDFSSDTIIKLLIKSLAAGVLSGLVLGVLNVFFKVVPFQEKG